MPSLEVVQVADFAAIAAAGRSIERLLHACFEEEEPVDGQRTRAVLVRSSDFDSTAIATAIGSPALSVFFYRVDLNRIQRAAWSAIGSQDGRAHLPLDCHFLITQWANNADEELRILGKAMQCLESSPVLGGPLLHPSSDWAPNESLQVVLGEISTEEVMRTFDSLPTDYRLSVPYVARLVRISSRIANPDAPATTLVTGMTPSLTP